jgi:acyl-CoA synthetase (NDP forming)/GNAT superfamily N-acetyltransferase
MAQAIPRPDEPAYALLADGRTVEIRPARPSDGAGVREMYDAMSEENRRLRFFGIGRGLGQQTADRICGPERQGAMALLALHRERVVGTAEYEAGPDDSADIGLAVADDFHGRGVGTLLLEHLVHAARTDGVTTFTADTLADNNAVLQVFSELGLPTERRYEGGEVRWRIRLDAGERYLRSVDSRGRTADVASLEPLLRPRSLVVVGAGRSAGSVGRAVLRNLRRSGFPGKMFAVNPHAHAIERAPCYSTVAELPLVPDLAVVAVPAPVVTDVARQCGEAGVRALTVLSSGLAPQQAAELLARCRQHDMRLVGPNCLGVANTEAGIGMDATFAAGLPAAGSAGLAAQSGGVGIALLAGLARLGMGVSSFVSLGDKYDVSGNDMLQWWEEDGRTELALLHLESFGNPRAFSRTARRVARRMPVLTVDAGRSEVGRRAAASHTAAAATPTMTRQALFRQAGVVATRSLGDLLGAAALVHSQPLPTGSSVAVVSNAGGTGVLAADACSEAGLRLPPLPRGLADNLREVLPPGASVSNPLDTTAAVGEGALTECVDLLAGWEQADAVLVLLVPVETAAACGDDPAQALLAPSRISRASTVVAVLPDQAERVRLLPSADGGALPSYADPQDAARALAYAAERSRWLARPPGTVPERFPVDVDAVRRTVRGFLADHPDGGWLDPPTRTELLVRYGIPRAAEAWTTSEEGAVREAAALGPPGTRLALKGYAPGVLHKSRVGAVHLDLSSPDEVREAYRRTAERLGTQMTGVVLQRMVPRGVELVAGVVQDEVFGPLVLFGLGGTATDVLADHAARLAPLTDTDIGELLDAPRCAALLTGEAEGEPVDRKALEQVVTRLSQLADDVPELAEAELNPMVARPDGVTAVDCRIRLVPARPPRPDGDAGVRRLR